MPERWGRCLLNTCYSLWFLHLPAMLQVSNQPANVLHQAYELLVKMQKLRLDPMEEVCVVINKPLNMVNNVFSNV